MVDLTRRLYEAVIRLKKVALGVNVRIVTHNEQLALDELLGHPDGERRMTITELSQSFNASMPAVSRLVKQLEEKGLATRVTDDDDRRFVYVSATDKGRDCYARNTELISGILTKAVEGIDPEEVERCLSIARRILMAAEAEIRALEEAAAAEAE